MVANGCAYIVCDSLDAAARAAEGGSMKEVKLKPCPFCGGEAKILVKCDRIIGNKYVATCRDNHCIGRVYRKWHSEQAAREAWNRRDCNVT